MPYVVLVVQLPHIIRSERLTGPSSQLGQQTKLNEYYFHYLASLAPNHLYLLVML